MRPIIVWLRRDLRVDDNAALVAASRSGAPVIPLFIFDTELIRRLPSDGAAFDFQAESLREVASDLRRLGGALVVRHGKPEDVHLRLLQEMGPAALYFNRDYEPDARERDKAVRRLYEQRGVEIRTFKDSVLQEPEEVLTADGRPYVVFTPYSRSWKEKAEPEPFGSPSRFLSPQLPTEEISGARDLKRVTAIPSPAFRGGASHAAKAWKGFLSERIGTYQKTRDIPGISGTSRISPYLRFGCISVRRMLADCRATERRGSPARRASVEKFIDELIWREFYQAVLFHFPRLLKSNYRQEFDRLPWRFDDRLFISWKEGRTGYPLVDAGMRELNSTGWMHNRVRMVVASFLTKDMLHDWRLGEKVFEEKLMDIETASNNGGWQWSASTGVDPRPLRIFNPVLQSKRYDPEGAYIRAFVPELTHVPRKFLHAPHTMPPVLQKETGCVVGKTYPAPIVDHALASREYKKVFARVKAESSS